MIDVQAVEQLNSAIRALRANHARGMGTMELIRSLEIDPLTELRGSDWRGTDFAGCDLRNADFSECRLAYCDFTEADVAGAVFYGADLYRSTLHRATNVTLAYLSPEQLSYIEKLHAFDVRGAGTQARVFQVNQKIRAATTFNAAKVQFRSILDAGLSPDQYSAGLLIGRAQTGREAWEALDIIDASRCKVNAVVFTVLASKMRSAGAVREVMDLMVSRGVAPGTRIYNTLLSRVSSGQGQESVLAEMDSNSIKRDNVTYCILMKRTDFSGRRVLFDRLLADGLHPTTTELNILMAAARDEDDADEIIEIANEQEIGRDEETYALLAPFKVRESAFRALVDDMIEDGLFREVRFYETAIARVGSFSDACVLVGRMKRDAVQPNSRIYKALGRFTAHERMETGPWVEKSPGLAIDRLVRRVGSEADIAAAGARDESRG